MSGKIRNLSVPSWLSVDMRSLMEVEGEELKCTELSGLSMVGSSMDWLEMGGGYVERLLRRGEVEALDISSGVGFQASTWD